ncbi:hypothetical protein RI129_007874 [Pyrocoelia pectoralis]|uniref:Cytochrome P450 n=1 Tax=Pyrocoelia pectoralis TaxID=417401 RepID=A0AAN7VIF7_9COLE
MWFLILSTALLLLIFKLKKVFSYWKDRGVDYVNPLYYFGSFYENILRCNSRGDILHDIYNKFPNKRYVGFYNCFQPILLIRDIELIKRITVKDHETFHSHSEFIPPELDSLWSRNIVALQDRKLWNNLRSSLTPIFTTYNLKSSFTILQQFSNNFVNYLVNKSDGKNIIVEMKEITQRFSSDITAYYYFGAKCDAINNPDNQVHRMMGKAMMLSFLNTYTNVMGKLCPKILKWTGARAYSQEVRNFFFDIMKQSIKIRLENKSSTSDVISALMRFYKAEEYHINDVDSNILEDITAHAFVLLFSEYESVTSILSLIWYELTLNPDIQRKLYEEIVDTLEKFGGSVSYDAIMSMGYLDNFFDEILRLHQPNSIIDRRAMRDYIIEAENPGEKDIIIEKGATIWILQKGIQMDPDYFSNPETFDPDRFSNENKHNIKNGANMPFGSGPRSCPGNREFYTNYCISIF